jgi:ABC-type sugar transport system substrate-binding protein
VFSAYQKETARLCGQCSTTSIDVTIAQFEGGAVPGIIVSKLEQDPSISYIAFPAGSYSAGIDSALKGAGLTRVKVIGQAGISTSWTGLKEGTEAAWNGFPYQYLGWLIVDTAIRDLAHQPFQSTGAKIPFELFTHANAPAANFQFQGVPNYQEQFKKLWHVG